LLWRQWYWRNHYRELRARYGDTRHLVYFGGVAIGDELLCSAPLHELKKRGEQNFGVMTSRPELFTHSSDVDRVYEMRLSDIELLKRLDVRLSPTGYIQKRLPPDIDVPPPHHIIAEMCRAAGVRGEVALRPYLYLDEQEKAAAAQYEDCVVVQSARRGATLNFGNKEWMPERFQAVATVLSASHRIVQVGTAEDPPLHGVIDLRGKTTLRQSAAILARASAFIGIVGLTMHLARAVNCRSVIIYGGREHPEQSGYPCNENLYSAEPCAPCWRWNSCDFDRRCLRSIEPADVIAAFERLLARRQTRLETAVYSLS
jgi:hypothetical protein